MARKKKSKKPPRSTDSYLYSADNLSKLVPGLKKYRKRKTLTRYEKAAISRREKQLKNIPHLQPLTPKQAKKLGSRKVFLPGIQAIQLRGVDTGKGDKVYINKRGDIRVKKPTGDEWIYWPLERDVVRSRPGMRDAGKAAFDKRLPIEKVSDLTAEAFQKLNVQEVRLWAHAGIVGEGFNTIGEFIGWVNEKWNQGRYISSRATSTGAVYESPSDPGKWVNGIAILIENPEYTARRNAIDAETQTNQTVDKPAKRKRKRRV